MIGADDVKDFLKQFNIKAQVFGILFICIPVDTRSVFR